MNKELPKEIKFVPSSESEYAAVELDDGPHIFAVDDTEGKYDRLIHELVRRYNAFPRAVEALKECQKHIDKHADECLMGLEVLIEEMEGVQREEQIEARRNYVITHNGPEGRKAALEAAKRAVEFEEGVAADGEWSAEYLTTRSIVQYD